MMRRCKDFLDVIGRRKSWDLRGLHQTDLTRSLNVLDIIGIGIGSCTGLGIYVTSAHVARREAGPAVVLSVLVAGLAALISGLCHIELATRLPRSGTGYTFCYVIFGELLAFVIGWNLILENVINGAVAAKAVWYYAEYMYNYTADNNVTDTDDVTEGHIFATAPDIFPCCLVIGMTFMTLITVKTFAIANFVLTSIGGLFLVAFICVGFLHVDSENWKSEPGFFSHGLEGIISGAALLMSTFASIDNLASCAEESHTPSKSLPAAFTFVISIVFTAIFLATMAFTLATPWQQLLDNAALARAYEIKGIYFANYVIGVGAIFGLLPVLMGSFLHPVRLMYSMSTDNLFPTVFSKIAFNGVPIVAHFITGIFISLSALLMEYSTLLEISSISTILQFIVSPIILVCIRYQPQSIGINREYTDLDITTVYDDACISKKYTDFQENGPKVLLLANGEHTIQRNDQSLYKPNSVSSSVSTTGSFGPVAAKGVGFKQQMYCSTDNDSFHQLWTPSNLSLSKSLTSSKNASSQKDILTNGHAGSVCTRQGCNLCGSSGTALSNYSEIRNNTPDVVLTGKEIVNQSTTRYGVELLAVFPCDKAVADERTWKLTRHFLLVYILTSTCLVIACQAWYDHYAETWWAVILACLCLVVMMLSAWFIARLPQNRAHLYFKTPYVPFVPLLSVAVNMTLLASLPVLCWTRFALWLLPGLMVYAFYSRRQKNLDELEVALFDISQPSSNIN